MLMLSDDYFHIELFRSKKKNYQGTHRWLKNINIDALFKVTEAFFRVSFRVTENAL